VAFKIRQNVFSAGAPAGRRGELTTLPQTPSRLGGIPIPITYPTHSAPSALAKHYLLLIITGFDHELFSKLKVKHVSYSLSPKMVAQKNAKFTFF